MPSVFFKSDLHDLPTMNSHDEAQLLADRLLSKNSHHPITDPQLLADRLLSQRPPRPQILRRPFQTIRSTNPSRRHAQDLAAEIFGRKDPRKKEKIAQRERARASRRRRHEKRPACWDWMLSSGNVHYAASGSMFSSYTKLSPANSFALLGRDGAIGVGTVHLAVPRARGAPDLTSITLYDVLHVPSMPCNAIAIPRLQDAGVGVLRGGDRTVLVHSKRNALLFEARRAAGELHRVCLAGEAEFDVRLELPDDVESGIELNAKDAEVRRLGSLARELAGERHEVVCFSGEENGVCC